tara:strand:- start:783 stop:1196 length:414 start_codon:yes stop_codon:yes gene_type:complete
MEENSARWLALREGARRLLVEQNLTIQVPDDHYDRWYRLILHMGDSMPQRIEFPLLKKGQFSAQANGIDLFLMSRTEPNSTEPLWLPFTSESLLHDLLQMCSELLLAGYPGCSGCGYKDEELEWNELTHRRRLNNSN